MRVYRVKFKGKKDGKTYVYETDIDAENIEAARRLAEEAKEDGEVIVSVKYKRNA